ncbi:ABC transporter permease [Stutzerimonas stutzeri]|uniref:ABC transporter permease n=1 Tax=Stutzerimonas stutzeri TaxID=316 RepID=UPI0021ADA79A|nr:ABC transporter permease [Stutzerimonas stutzeri]MDH0500536.1 ABC transporter permease [Stutzerimonas stutzeri]WGG17700.1 ABC transporter permease [Stutzerimonas stutzeri]
MNSLNIFVCFRLAFRARFGWLAFGVLLLMVLTSLLSAQFGSRQPTTVALDTGISVMRISLPLIIVLLTQEVLSREFDRRYFLNTLTYPHPRHTVLLGRTFAVATLTLGLLFVMACVLAMFVKLIGQGYTQSTPVALGTPYLVTVGFIGLDALMLTAVATVLAVAASTPSFVLIGTFGFMLVARSFGTIVELLTRNTGVVSDADGYRSGIGILSYLLPDLGALDVRVVALYGKWELLPADWHWLVLTSVTYMVGLLSLAVWSLNRKRFT